MQISETTSDKIVQNPNAPLSYTFNIIPFEGFSKEMNENLLKWGLSKSLKLKIFRFNVAYTDLNASAFLQDLLTSEEFQSQFPGLAAKAKTCTKVGYNKLRITQLNMNFLDTLEEEGLIRKNGRMAPTFGEVINSVEIVNLVRDAWLNEDGEYYPAYTEDMRKELIIQLFNFLVIGGSLNQYDDYVEPYRIHLKELYKELITVRKEGESGGVFCDCLAYSVEEINVSI